MDCSNSTMKNLSACQQLRVKINTARSVIETILKPQNKDLAERVDSVLSKDEFDLMNRIIELLTENQKAEVKE